MINQEDIFTYAGELYQAKEFFRSQTKEGRLLVQPGSFLLPKKPQPTEELMVIGKSTVYLG